MARRGKREHIALMSPKGCVGVELGVALGTLADRFMRLNHFEAFHAVDKWDDDHDPNEYRDTVELLKKYDKCTVHRMEAKAWLETIEDGSLGFIYIDCYATTGQEDGAILTAAWPKLSYDGLFAGDDYLLAKYPRTVAAVDKFAKKHGIEVSVYDRHLDPLYSQLPYPAYDRFPSWYLRKC